MSRANTPFSGLTVLDFSRYLPGGYATQVLADLGATVIKVEDTGLGDFMRHDYPTKGGGILLHHRTWPQQEVGFAEPQERRSC